ncbi:HAMP domain-containing sensor histidine kinase [Paenibacillus sp. IITD108]|uniref:HAMP domain-containing sensor histidine kinase n=1 Tax=Paenibacillus sp. IITD108 TaxID=3116649 RepID=UPI002F400F44
MLLILGASFFYVYTSSLITYFILAIVIVIHLIGIKRERRRVVLSFRIKTIRYFTPVMIGFLVISNLTRMESVGGELVSIVMIIITAIALFDGSLGIRLHPEINSLIGTRKTMTTGVSIINHTIKNEMAKIQFLISKIEEELEQTKNQLLKKWIVSIRESSIHLTQINKRIKRLTHDIRLSRELTKLSTVVRSIYDESITINQAKANPVKISLFVETDFVMQLDRLHLKEALKNIIINSQESFKDIKRQPKIRISLKEVNGRAVLSIADNGKGIPHKMLSNIREPFFTSKKGGANFGLGLSYCQNIFDLHGIKMKIKSIEGRGTVVSLIFKKKLIRTKSK